MKNIKPFGPSIAKITIPEESVKEMNLFVDEMIKDKDKLEKFNEGPRLVGNVLIKKKQVTDR